MPWLTAAHPYMPCAAAPPSVWEGRRPAASALQKYGHRWQCPVPAGVADPATLDMLLMEDGRLDGSGPGNGGLLFIRSNCRTRRFMRAWFSGLPAMVNQRSGQLLINRLLMSASINVSMGLLPPQLFLNGPHLVGRGYLLNRTAAGFPMGWMVAHASVAPREPSPPAPSPTMRVCAARPVRPRRLTARTSLQWTGNHREKLGCFWLLGAAYLHRQRLEPTTRRASYWPPDAEPVSRLLAGPRAAGPTGRTCG
jgi:hypothetical protein